MANLRHLIAFLLDIASRVPRGRALLGVVLLSGAAAGLSATALIALVNRQLQAGELPYALAGFAALALVQPGARFLSSTLLVYTVQKSIFELRMGLCRGVLRAPLRQLEDMGASKLLASLTDDIAALSAALGLLPILGIELVILAGCLGYLFWLDWRGGLVTVGIFAFGMLTYRWPLALSHRHFARFREEWTRLFQGLEALTRGAKELKLHGARREEFLDRSLERPLRSLQRAGLFGNAYSYLASNWGQILFFVLIGGVLFAGRQRMGVGQEVVTGYVLTILFMMGPVDLVANMLPQYNRARVAAVHLRRLEERLRDSAEGAPASPAPSSALSPEEALPDDWETLELRGVTHSYWREAEGDSFTLGPVDLTLRRGELVFIAGGNGSGKTTLGKLILGLYEPEAGALYLGGRKIDDGNREAYRQLFSAVFTDFYLFAELLGLRDAGADDRAREYLRGLGLEHKVTVEDGSLSTVDLSQGQRKRLALLTAYMEDRPIYLFDEWAADQDPTFRRTFYREILPSLQARGKTVLVITHDDGYFEVADRLLKIDYGRIARDERPGENAPGEGRGGV